MRRLIAVMAMTLALVFAGSTLAAPPAHAGNCTVSWGNAICGRVTNVGTIGIRLISSWPNTLGAYLPAGQTSTRYHKDTDGIVVYGGHKAKVCMAGICNTYGPGYVKLTDNIVNWQVRQYSG